MKCAKWVLVSLIVMAPALHALDVSYGNFLTITGIERAAGKVILPVERKKYYNVRILDKDTYQFVTTCPAPCVQKVANMKVTVADVRAAKERPDMWIADVAFNQDWQITFLVFKQGDTYRVKSPIHLIFVQQALKKRTEEAIVAAVKELK
jgi:hypothetical protein